MSLNQIMDLLADEQESSVDDSEVDPDYNQGILYKAKYSMKNIFRKKTGLKPFYLLKQIIHFFFKGGGGEKLY